MTRVNDFSIFTFKWR